MKFVIFTGIVCRHIQILVKINKAKGLFTWKPANIPSVTHQVFEGAENVSNQIVEKSETRFIVLK
jgi:hypothetical protein